MANLLRVKCAVIGDAAIGKTALIQVFLHDRSYFPKNYSMTTGVTLSVGKVNIPDTKDAVELYLYDCSGKEVYLDFVQELASINLGRRTPGHNNVRHLQRTFIPTCINVGFKALEEQHLWSQNWRLGGNQGRPQGTSPRFFQGRSGDGGEDRLPLRGVVGEGRRRRPGAVLLSRKPVAQDAQREKRSARRRGLVNRPHTALLHRYFSER
ncbi:uncharacterized protein LOC119179688 isoform X1 [Rhipicephalus microplus]|uniref:uncharacterized protein LOC119179688 isoform X1 n=1 Tax=Rhipicephalus microplus TaxID=6941 RepID=UPI003F6B2FB4